MQKDAKPENGFLCAFVSVVKRLPNTAHTLEIIANGDGDIPVKEVRVYSPPLK